MERVVVRAECRRRGLACLSGTGVFVIAALEAEADMAEALLIQALLQIPAAAAQKVHGFRAVGGKADLCKLSLRLQSNPQPPEFRRIKLKLNLIILQLSQGGQDLIRQTGR